MKKHDQGMLNNGPLPSLLPSPHHPQKYSTRKESRKRSGKIM